MEKIFATGLTGHLGIYVLDALEDAGIIPEQVRGISRNEDWVSTDLFTCFQGDVANKESLRRAMAGCSVVLHMAAEVSFRESEESRKDMFDTNVKGTQNVVDVAQELGIRKIVFLSAAATRISPHFTIVSEGTRAEYPNDCTYVHTKLWAEGIIEHSKIPDKTILYLANTRLDLFDRAIYGRRVVFCPPGLTNTIDPARAAQIIVSAVLTDRQPKRLLIHGEDQTYRGLLRYAAYKKCRQVWVIRLPHWTKRIAQFIASMGRDYYFTPFTVGQAYSIKVFQSLFQGGRNEHDSRREQPALV
mgnify:CR=1 FL=1